MGPGQRSRSASGRVASRVEPALAFGAGDDVLGEFVELVLPVERDAGDRPWQRAAACRGEDRSVCFYPPVHHESRDERALREGRAKAICQDCPVRQPCLTYALGIREPFGIWGGLTEYERRSILESAR